jgi:SAM-dependent methyltransferase
VTPTELAIDHTVSFLTEALRGRQRILEVGCGRGDVARRLGATGVAITAIDLELPDPSPSPNVTFLERDLLQVGGAPLDGAPFDAIVFTASLHHISPLTAAIDRAYRLLVPGGLFVADEFDLEAPSAPTLRWYYDAQDLLAAAELFPPDHVDPPTDLPAGDIVQRWRSAHTHEPPLHTGVQMRRAVAEHFDLRDVRGTAYLYRHLTKHLPRDARGVAVAQHLYSSERRGIDDATLSAVGLRIMAVRA